MIWYVSVWGVGVQVDGQGGEVRWSKQESVHTLCGLERHRSKLAINLEQLLILTFSAVVVSNKVRLYGVLIFLLERGYTRIYLHYMTPRGEYIADTHVYPRLTPVYIDEIQAL